MPSCEVCGEDEFECHDGLYYCMHCQTQSQHFLEVEQDDEAAFSHRLSVKTPKKASDSKEQKKREQDDAGRPWTTDEGFQLILREQVKSLIKMGADPVLKDVIFKFWTLYLSKLGMAFSDQERSKAFFTKMFPHARDIYVPTCENARVPDIRRRRTMMKKGTMKTKDRKVDKLVVTAMLGEEEFYEGDNPFDERVEEEEAAEEDQFVAIAEDNYTGGMCCPSPEKDDDVLDSDSEGSLNSDRERPKIDGPSLQTMETGREKYSGGGEGEVESSASGPGPRRQGDEGSSDSSGVMVIESDKKRDTSPSSSSGGISGDDSGTDPEWEGGRASRSKSGTGPESEVGSCSRTTRSKRGAGSRNKSGAASGSESVASSRITRSKSDAASTNKTGVSSGSDGATRSKHSAASRNERGAVSGSAGSEDESNPSTAAAARNKGGAGSGSEGGQKGAGCKGRSGEAAEDKDTASNAEYENNSQDDVPEVSDEEGCEADGDEDLKGGVGTGESDDDEDDDFEDNIDEVESIKPLNRNKITYGHNIARTAWRPQKMTTLAFCYIGLAFTNGNITISDILRWVKSGVLPYDNINEIFPDDMTFGSKDSQTFCGLRGREVPEYGKLTFLVSKICRFLGFVPPQLNLDGLISRYIIDLNLPGQLNALALQLLKNSPRHPEAASLTIQGPFPYEAMAMAYIVITIKLVFGLDDKTERDLSSYSRKVKKILETTGNKCAADVFIWEDWVTHIEEVIGRRRSQQIFSSFDDLKGIQDLDVYLKHNKNRAKLGKFYHKMLGGDGDLTDALKKPVEALVEKFEQVKLSARKSQSSADGDFLESIFGTEADTREETNAASASKNDGIFFRSSLHHIVNPQTFLSDLRKGDVSDTMPGTSGEDEVESDVLEKKRRRLDSDMGHPDKNMSEESKSELDELIEGLAPACEEYVLYEPGKVTPGNRHVSYLWLLNLCSMFTECTCQDIDDCVNRIQYFMPRLYLMRRWFSTIECPRGLIPR